ncbi:MAG: TIGR02265 family protein [Ignavibacteria bacterium]
MEENKPTIKGIFVNSHLKTLKNQKGEKGMRELERRYNKPLDFKNSDNLLVSEEVKIIELALEIMSEKPVPENERSFEAGRLHFRNFTTTPLARIIFSVFRKNYKLMMIQTKNIAGHVFQGVKFYTEDLGPNSVRVVMKNNDYPIEHFKGLFYEWMLFAGYEGTVEAKEIPPGYYEYTMEWE